MIQGRFILACCFVFLFFLNNTSFALDSPTFEGAEHIFIGDAVKIHLPGKGNKAKNLIHLPNGLELTYGDIVTMGDFYEIVGRSLAKAKTEGDKTLRFKQAFESLAKQNESAKEARKIIKVLHEEQAYIEDAIKRGEDPEDVYKKIGNETNRQLNCITGGGCGRLWWLKQGRYLKLAAEDFDHFGNHAWTAYRIGHEIALSEALEARRTGNPNKLEYAYALNAFASHFLSDRFSSGHIRTPRLGLVNHVRPGLVGTLLAHYMHNEENSFGLHVHNERGNQWIAYGDHAYLSPKNDLNRKYLHEALQISADEIYNAYAHGAHARTDLKTLLPIPNETKNTAYVDIAPMFYWDKNRKKLMRRSELENPFDRHWTSKWWGFSTLALLAKERGMSPQYQASLALADLGEEALQAGMITEPAVRNYIVAKK